MTFGWSRRDGAGRLDTCLSCPTCGHHRCDGRRCFHRVRVLPDLHGKPARLVERPPCVFVPLSVPSDLLAPERRVGLWHCAVFGTPVPEASIDEHSHPGRPEHNVGRPPVARQWPSVDSVPQAHRMQYLPKPKLDVRVLRALATHSRTCGGRRLHSRPGAHGTMIADVASLTMPDPARVMTGPRSRRARLSDTTSTCSARSWPAPPTRRLHTETLSFRSTLAREPQPKFKLVDGIGCPLRKPPTSDRDRHCTSAHRCPDRSVRGPAGRA